MEDVLGLMDESDEKNALEVRVTTVLDDAKKRQIKNEKEYVLMGEFLIDIKAAGKDVNAYFDPLIKTANKTVTDLRLKKREQSYPLDTAEGIAKQKMKVYHDEEMKKQLKALEDRRKETARLQEIANKEAEIRRETAQATEAEQAKTEGRDAEAVEVETPVVEETLPEIAQEVPKVAGISFAEKWCWEEEDFAKVPDLYKKLDTVKINGYVRSMKNDANISGIRVYADKTLKARV